MYNSARVKGTDENVPCGKCEKEVNFRNYWIKTYKLCEDCKRKEDHFKNYQSFVKKRKEEHFNHIRSKERKRKEESIERERMRIIELEEEKRIDNLVKKDLLYRQEQLEFRKRYLERNSENKKQTQKNICSSCGKSIDNEYGRCGCSG